VFPLFVAALMISGCQDNTETVAAVWPDEQMDLAFFVVIGADGRLEKIEGPFFDSGEATLRFGIPENSRIQLVGWTREAIEAEQPYADLTRLSEARLRVAADEDCNAQSFDGELSFAEVGPTATRLELGADRSFQPVNSDVLEELELAVPANSSGYPNDEERRMAPFSGSDAHVFVEGSVVGGVPRSYLEDDAESFFRFHNLLLLDREHAVVVAGRFVFLLERSPAEAPLAVFDLMATLNADPALRAGFVAPYITGSTRDPESDSLLLVVADNALTEDQSMILRVPVSASGFGAPELAVRFESSDLTFLAARRGLYVVARGVGELGVATDVLGPYTFKDTGIELKRVRLSGDPVHPIVIAAGNGSIQWGDGLTMQAINLVLRDFGTLSDIQTELTDNGLVVWASDNLGGISRRRVDAWEEITFPVLPPASLECARVDIEFCGRPFVTDLDSFSVVKEGDRHFLYFVPGPCAGLLEVEVGNNTAHFLKPANGVTYDSSYDITAVIATERDVYAIGKRALLTTYER
jgi:hypothetical protein